MVTNVYRTAFISVIFCVDLWLKEQITIDLLQLIYFVKADLMYTANNFLWDIYTQIFRKLCE